jgi:DNA-binding LacI/PurR family transcriptional regulator
MMKFEAVTIKDIAKALGLSTSTVSRALRDSYEISAETKEKVLAYARELNYRPNPIALSLKEKRSRSIGVLVSEIANSFFSQAINGIESVANSKGYNVVIAQSREDFEKEVSALQYLASRSVDGIVLSVSSETNDFSAINDLHKRGFPIVCFDRIIEEMNTHKVIVDNQKAAYDATVHLIKSGYKKIGHLANSEYLSITKDRMAGYQKALKDHRIEFNPDYVQHCLHGGMIYDEVERAMNALLQLKDKPNAIFASADKLTTNSLRYCKAKKINIPSELALIGFSNLDLTDLLSPSLSVVRQPAYEMGEMAADLLINIIEAKRAVTEFDLKVLPAQLIQRESTAKKIVK